MNRNNRSAVMELVWPFFAVIGFTGKILDRMFFSWWLGPLLQRKANKRLVQDVRDNLAFLCSCGSLMEETPLKVLPFDYASVCIIYKAVRFCFTAGRSQLNVTLCPVGCPQDVYELAVVIAALDAVELSEVPQLNNFGSVREVLYSHLGDVVSAFSDANYPQFRQALVRVNESARIFTRQTEWELNKRRKL